MKKTSENQIKWVSILGEFDIKKEQICYKGKLVPITLQEQSIEETKDRPSPGLLLNNMTLADGIIYADVEFEKVTPDTACEVAVSYDPNALHLVTAGIGGEPWAMFSIREFGGPRTGANRWWDHRVIGDRAMMRPNTKYHIEARFKGSMVSLFIDGVNIGTVEVSSPMGRARQVGLFCKADHSIFVSNYSVEAYKPKAFVVMQFGDQYDDVYNDVVKEVCKDYDVNVLRADEVMGSGLIISDIAREIYESQLIIADITPTNPNVFFEVGYSMALGKQMIMLAKKDTPLPFDIAGFRVLFYKDSIGGKKLLEEGLRKHIDSILKP